MWMELYRIRSTNHADGSGDGIRPTNHGDGTHRIRSTNHKDGAGDGIRPTNHGDGTGETGNRIIPTNEGEPTELTFSEHGNPANHIAFSFSSPTLQDLKMKMQCGLLLLFQSVIE